MQSGWGGCLERGSDDKGSQITSQTPPAWSGTGLENATEPR